ncbi:MAG TPA: hypothetical protein VD861_02940 [Pyrinomonadaceae bacterium]|nr:hypothetical protein [Pyrinomonadaceae bacterium]
MSRKKSGGAAAPRAPAEWVALSVSLLLLASVVALIVWLWVTEPAGPPQFKVERGAARSEAGVYHLPVAVTNVGGQAAGQVRVEGRLSGGGQDERPATTIEFLPVRAREEIVLMFRTDPSGASVEVVSYQQP